MARIKEGVFAGLRDDFAVIYADPPWAYKTWSKKGQGRSAESHYPTMGIEGIAGLPVGDLAAKDCALFMWVTFPCLRESFDVLDGWGFIYKTAAFTWVKRNRSGAGWFWGMGHWTRANAEICLLATKGSPKRIGKGVHSLIESNVTRHSEKPAVTRDRIVELMGDVPRIELFARKAAPGWDGWGNEYPGVGNFDPALPGMEKLA